MGFINNKLLTQLKILELMEIKSNFSVLARIYNTDWRTIKKYYDRYEGKPKHYKKVLQIGSISGDYCSTEVVLDMIFRYHEEMQ